MSRIDEQVKDVINEKKEEFNSDPDYRNLEIFLRIAKQRGLLERKGYSIPPTDTIGKRYRESVKAKVKDER